MALSMTLCVPSRALAAFTCLRLQSAEVPHAPSTSTSGVIHFLYGDSTANAHMADPLDSNALKDAKAGDLAALEKRLDSYPLSPEPDRNGDYATADQLVCAAAHGRHAEMVQWLIETRFPTYVARLQAHLAAIQGGPDIYAIFLHKWPHLIHYELGHMGNPLGLSVFNNDTPMIKFLLERGVDPNTAQIFHIQVRR